MRVRLSAECIINASAQFWGPMLAMALEPAQANGQVCVGAGHLVGSVTLTGAWVGRIEVRLAQGLAHEATVAMLMMPAESVGEADTLDATKEIANIIAGVIKSCLPRPSAMTVPEAGVEQESFADKPETGNSLAVEFRHPSGDLLVRVCELECAA
jgi:hypothetical protein